MNRHDFEFIKYFSWDEIEDTGANPRDLQFVLLEALDTLRAYMNKPFTLQKNGLTTGVHKAVEHTAGLAVDFYVKDITDKEVVLLTLKAATLGFNGIGVYWNGVMWSFHLDLRQELTTWYGQKLLPNYSWEYKPLRYHK